MHLEAGLVGYALHLVLRVPVAAQGLFFLGDYRSTREKSPTRKHIEASALIMSASIPLAKHHQALCQGGREVYSSWEALQREDRATGHTVDWEV